MTGTVQLGHLCLCLGAALAMLMGTWKLLKAVPFVTLPEVSPLWKTALGTFLSPPAARSPAQQSRAKGACQLEIDWALVKMKHSLFAQP